MNVLLNSLFYIVAILVALRGMPISTLYGLFTKNSKEWIYNISPVRITSERFQKLRVDLSRQMGMQCRMFSIHNHPARITSEQFQILRVDLSIQMGMRCPMFSIHSHRPRITSERFQMLQVYLSIQLDMQCCIYSIPIS